MSTELQISWIVADLQLFLHSGKLLMKYLRKWLKKWHIILNKLQLRSTPKLRCALVDYVPNSNFWANAKLRQKSWLFLVNYPTWSVFWLQLCQLSFQMSPTINRCVSDLIKLFDEKCDEGQAFDIYRYISIVKLHLCSNYQSQ